MDDMTINDLATMMAREFSRVYARFDAMDNRFDAMDDRFGRLEKRTMHVEELCEDNSGRLIGIDDRLSRIEYTLDEANPRALKKRVERLEKHSFGGMKPA